MGRDIGHVQGDAGRPQVPLSLSPAHRGRGVDSGGERRRRPLLTQFTTPKQCPDQQRQILVRRHHARFLQRGFFWKRQQRQAVECGNGRAAQEARGPQVTAFCQALRLDPPHRGRGVDSGGERRRRPQHLCSLTFEKMAAIWSTASPGVLTASFSRAAGPTTRSFCGTQKGRSPEDVRGPQVSQAFFFLSPPLTCLFCAIAGKTAKVTILPAALPRSPGERRRFRGGEA